MRILLLFLFLFSFAKERYLIAKFENIQPYYYNNQIVNLKLNIITALDGNISITDEFNNSYEFIHQNNYISNISFKLDKKFPTFIVRLEDIDELNVTPSSKIKYLHPPKQFCGILANELNVTDKILTNYDENYNILYLNIFSDGNTEDFSLGFVDEKLYKVDSKNIFYSYSALVPINKRDFFINYFDLRTQTYKTIKFSLSPKNDEISTQTDIKPMAKSRLYLINSILATIAVLFVVLYFYRKKVIYIVLLLLVIGVIVFLNLPKEQIVLKEGTKVHILPFEKSTTFMIIGIDTKVNVLATQGKYKKIEFNGHIGWVKIN